MAKAPERDDTQTEVVTGSYAGTRPALGLLRVHPRLGAEPIPLEPVMTVGRAPECTVSAPSETLSRHHARIDPKGALWRCMDLKSRNGTYVNGRRITDVPIGPGDVVRFGEWLGVLVRIPGEGYRGFGRISDALYGGDALRAALEPLERMARSSVHLVIEGETGSGKERVARAVHELSGRHGAYIPINCAALPLGLAEAELFGYRCGAFTGAATSHVGHVRAADGGTLVLDEICELPLALQAKLLRALEQKEVTPLGATRPAPVDLRVVALAQRPLDALVKQGQFRDDLRARLSVSLRVPPLRERVEDIPFLFDLFMRRATERMPDVQARYLEALLLYGFPRNVRELEQLVTQQRLLVGEVPLLRRSHLPDTVLRAGRRASSGRGCPANEPSTREKLPERAGGERRVAEAQDWTKLRTVLANNGGNIVQAARELGLSRYQAYRLIKASPDCCLAQLRERPSRVTGRSE